MGETSMSCSTMDVIGTISSRGYGYKRHGGAMTAYRSLTRRVYLACYDLHDRQMHCISRLYDLQTLSSSFRTRRRLIILIHGYLLRLMQLETPKFR